MLLQQDLLSDCLLDQLIQFRQQIHQHPELSGQEQQTAQRVLDFINAYHPDEVVPNLGGNGCAVIYRGQQSGPTVLIRADMDALPIQETSAIAHCSHVPHTAHACGHDGHMAIVAGLAALLHQQPIGRGSVVLLFQPAEETGEGAAQVVASPVFQALQPDYVFALHNLPRYPLGQVVIRSGSFAAASTGVIVRFQGKTSHAAYPEHGRSPALAMAQLVQVITALPQQLQADLADFVLTTVVHARLGEIAFGTAPGQAEVMATLRSYRNDDMATLKAVVEQSAIALAAADQLEVSLEWVESFPATENDPAAVEILKTAIATCQADWIEAETPFRWSEDFGHFTQRYPGALFGLGSGEQQPQLHNPDYDFPDALIQPGVQLFYQIIQTVLRRESEE
ncbi:MAG: amidohydrolase [Thainema sp.]